ncbi:transmembrane secretion effector [Breznakia blatticola]|uniref:Transmembrane secretion effector n=1 Tax=Breznakia blatticola TaxID=1754012 RepID=A0A4V3G903_9FIRM|nr:MFS transporter [Breznakia blatticola]TDW24924.1 transmembrane secretion effector [Breznakia blatticola]
MKEITRKMLIKDQPRYVRYMSANLINRFGDAVDSLATVWLTYEVTGSASMSALAYACNMLPTVILTPLLGAYVEKLNKKKVMVLVDFMRAVLVCLYLFLYVSGILNVAMILTLTVLTSSVEAFGQPAISAFVTEILDKEYYEVGVGTNRAMMSAMELVGNALAGIILATFGIAGAFVVDGCTFVIAALLKLSIPYKQRIHEQHANTPYLTMLKDGFVYLRKSKVLLTLCFIGLFLNASLVPFNAVLAPYIGTYLNGSPMFLSLVSIGVSAGAMFGGFLYPTISKKISTNMQFAIAGICAALLYFSFTLVAVLSLPLYVSIALLFVFIFFMGVAVSIGGSIANITFISRVDQEYLSRSSAIIDAFFYSGMPITSVVVSIVVASLSIPQVFLIFGCICLACFGIILHNKTLKGDTSDVNTTATTI